MGSLDYPRAGSAAQIAIFQICAAPDAMLSIDDVRAVLETKHCSADAFRRNVLMPLQDLGLVNVRSKCFLIATDKAKAYALKFGKVQQPKKERYVGQVAAPRAVRPFKPLDVAKLRAPAPVRPGALDYRSIPSRMGSECRLPGGVD
ncbi:hypothetical protein [Undibacterium squillarum]|uniref:Uncharacterized protein n=1 Tax=Undibacterium squillarum TaxID=1131567 RepID=A0ABQ2Y3Z4_9BURK|nr:hypothetical protein [Undibacterium squillarum]GGX53115.1 hypothetical protein GCM10010946_34630 [Undibacterium squillarum]